MEDNTVITSLKSILADSYALYLKTQNYHWNVEGVNFLALHSLFEQQYTELASAIDTAAELIRGLGSKAPGTFEAYSNITVIKPGNENASAEVMIQDLIHDHEIIQKSLNKAIVIAQNNKDEVIVNFITERLTVHRKALWMLKSIVSTQ